MSAPPIPVNGALQFLQRCFPGIIRRKRQPLRQMGFSPAITARHNSSILLLALDHLVGSAFNSSPLAWLFLAWPTAIMMWTVTDDVRGVGVVAYSMLLNAAIYAFLGRLVWAVRRRKSN